MRDLMKLGFHDDDARTMVQFAQVSLGQEDCLLLVKYQARYEAHHLRDAQARAQALARLETYPQPQRYRVVDCKVMHRSRLERQVTEAAEWVALGI